MFFWGFGQEACGIIAPRPGIQCATPTLEGEVLITGPPGQSLHGPLIPFFTRYETKEFC